MISPKPQNHNIIASKPHAKILNYFNYFLKIFGGPLLYKKESENFFKIYTSIFSLINIIVPFI